MKQQLKPTPPSTSSEKRTEEKKFEERALASGASLVELCGLTFCEWVKPDSINMTSYRGCHSVATASLTSLIPYDDVTHNRFYFNRLFIDRDHRGKGLGTAMVKEIQCKMTDLQRGILCEPNPYDGPKKMPALLRFYKKLGFRIHRDEGVGTCLLWDPPPAGSAAPSNGGSAQMGG